MNDSLEIVDWTGSTYKLPQSLTKEINTLKYELKNLLNMSYENLFLLGADGKQVRDKLKAMSLKKIYVIDTTLTMNISPPPTFINFPEAYKIYKSLYRNQKSTRELVEKFDSYVSGMYEECSSLISQYVKIQKERDVEITGISAEMKTTDFCEKLKSIELDPSIRSDKYRSLYDILEGEDPNQILASAERAHYEYTETIKEFEMEFQKINTSKYTPSLTIFQEILNKQQDITVKFGEWKKIYNQKKPLYDKKEEKAFMSRLAEYINFVHKCRLEMVDTAKNILTPYLEYEKIIEALNHKLVDDKESFSQCRKRWKYDRNRLYRLYQLPSTYKSYLNEIKRRKFWKKHYLSDLEQLRKHLIQHIDQERDKRLRYYEEFFSFDGIPTKVFTGLDTAFPYPLLFGGEFDKNLPDIQDDKFTDRYNGIFPLSQQNEQSKLDKVFIERSNRSLMKKNDKIKLLEEQLNNEKLIGKQFIDDLERRLKENEAKSLEIDTVHTKLDHALQTSIQLKELNQNHSTEIQSLTTELNEMRKRCDLLESTKLNLSNQIALYDKENLESVKLQQKLLEDQNKYIQESKRLIEENNKWSYDVLELNKVITDLNNQIKSQQRDKEDNQVNHDKIVDTLNKRISDLEKLFETSKSTDETLNNHIKELQKEKSLIQTNADKAINTLNKRIKELEKQVETSKSTEETLNKRINTYETENQKLKSQIHQLTSSTRVMKTELESQISTLKSENQKVLQQSINNQSTNEEIQKLKIEFEKTILRLSSVNKELTQTKDDQAKEFNDQITKLMTQIQEEKHSSQQLQKRLIELESTKKIDILEYDTLINQLIDSISVEKTVSDPAKNAVRIHEGIQTMQTENKLLNDKIDELNQTIDKFTKQIADLENKNNEAKQEIARQTKLNEKLKQTNLSSKEAMKLQTDEYKVELEKLRENNKMLITKCSLDLEHHKRCLLWAPELYHKFEDKMPILAIPEPQGDKFYYKVWTSKQEEVPIVVNTHAIQDILPKKPVPIFGRYVYMLDNQTAEKNNPYGLPNKSKFTEVFIELVYPLRQHTDPM
eukprot:TRINITY_DN531_c0_g1_i6.p1 TRINITY_DN531_c0_g1~~TRINITY_DN531_c0_g1_i6.p1  ORF type:complete len:1055 (-),score=253.63 TRINITY_DN531_c0_g1_i6:936-4100(-)